jgi:hypothetical protein
MLILTLSLLPYGIDRSHMEFILPGWKHGFDLKWQAHCIEGVYETGHMNHLLRSYQK